MTRQLHRTSHPGRLFSLSYTEDTGECQLLALDDRELTILRRMVAVFPKYYWVWGIEKTLLDWDTADTELWDTIQSIIEELEVKLMSGCNTQDMINAIEGISDAVVSSGGPASSLCCGDVIPNDSIIPADAVSGSDMETETPPPGFTGTWEEYETHKCKAANMIVDDFISTLYGLATVSGLVTGMSAGLAYLVINAALFGGGSSLVAAGVLGIIGLGFSATVTVAALVTAMVALFLFGGAGLGYLATLADSVDANKSDYVCALYNANDNQEAIADIGALLDDAYDVGWSEPLRDILDQITLLLLSDATLNVLFEDNEDVSDYTSGTVSCDACAPSPVLLLQFGVTGDEVMPGIDIEISSVWVAGPNRYYVGIYNSSSPCQPFDLTVSGCTVSSGWMGGGIEECDGSRPWWYDSQTNPNGFYAGARDFANLSNSVPFSLTMRFDTI